MFIDEPTSKFASQRGQDKSILKLLEVIEPLGDGNSNTNWGVEFGAWDGIFASNLKFFHDHLNYNVIWIEPDKKRFKALQNNYKNSKSAILMNCLVTPEGETSLDNLLKKTAIPYDFDVLIIDIDGNDYLVWEALKAYKPKIVVIEFNPTIPLWMEFVQDYNSKDHEQHSFKSTIKLAKEKGYELVETNGNDAFLVRNEYFPLFGIVDNSIETLFKPYLMEWQTWLWQTTSGRLKVAGNNQLKWHNLYIPENRIQILPKVLQFFPGKTNKFLQFMKWFFYKSPLIRKIYSFAITGKTKNPEVSSNTKHLTF